MSDVGLHVGLCQNTRKLAELVDNVLITVKTDQGGDSEFKVLGNILLEVSKTEWRDLTSLMLSLMVRNIPETEEKDWGEVGEALLSRNIDSNVVKRLERLAWALERVQVEAGSRVRE